jgi:spermidine synthase
MIPWVQLDTSAIPGEQDALRLMRRGDEFSIVVGTIELMNNRLSGSEKALATLTCDRLRDPSRAQILIGGLGMGFTLRAALDGLGPDARVVVAELVPAVAAWARGPLSHMFAGSLDDPRVELRVEDVGRVIQAGPAHYDAILLDVDNGPEGLTQRANDRLYDIWGLKRARFALKESGVLAVWSGNPDRKFKARLQRAGFDVEEVRVHANGSRGRRHVLWFGRRVEESTADQLKARAAARPSRL